MSNVERIKQLREQTGAGVVDIQKALEEAAGDPVTAVEILRKRGQDKALKKSNRDASEGIVASYVHSNKRVGVLVKLCCETDFVARNEEFQALAKDIAMHIAALAPLYLKPEDVPSDVIERERDIWREQLRYEGKTDEMITKILPGKEEKFRKEAALFSQSFVKDPSKTVADLITENIQKIGENITVSEFVRYAL